MKSFLRPVLALALVICLVGCGGGEPAEGDAAPRTARADLRDVRLLSSSFQSDFFEFGIAWNAPWTGDGTAQMQEMMTGMMQMASEMSQQFGANEAEVNAAIDQTAVLLLLTDGPMQMMAEEQPAMMLLLAVPVPPGQPTMKAILQAQQTSGTSTINVPAEAIETMDTVVLGGRSFERLQAKVDENGTVTHTKVLGFVKDGYLAMFSMGAPTTAKLQEMDAIMGTMQFYN